jgi:flagellar biosynthesis/type III secretory pathway M-ring protein FliF/YscJ
MDWLWKTLNAFAAVCLVLFVIQFLLFVILVLFLVTLKREERQTEATRRREQKLRESQFNKNESEEQHLKPVEEEDKVLPPQDISHDTNTIELGSFRPNDSQRGENTFDFLPSGFKQ